MASRMYLPTFFMMTALGMMIGAAKGSSLVFEKTPSVVNPLFDEKLTLRCSLHDVTVAAKTGVSDVTVIKDNITIVNSIVIYKETDTNTKEYIAGVSHSAAARPMTTGLSLNVTGDVQGHSADRGYLQVVWDRPGYNQKGTFGCEVNILHGFVMTMTYFVGTTVVVHKPTLEDVVNRLYHMDDEYSKKIIKEKEDMTKEFNSKIKAMAEEFNSKIKAMAEEFKNTNKAMAKEFNSKNSALETALDKAKHIEMGTYDCDRSGVPGKFPINFSKRYTTPPRVYVTGVRYHEENVDRTRYDIHPTSVSTTGFRLYCGIPNTDMFGGYLWATWISLPN